MTILVIHTQKTNTLSDKLMKRNIRILIKAFVQSEKKLYCNVLTFDWLFIVGDVALAPILTAN